MEVCSCLSATMRYSQVAKAAAQEHNLAVAGAVLERLPGIAQAAAELGDDRLQMLEENGLIFTGANDSPMSILGFHYYTSICASERSLTTCLLRF